MKRFLAVVLSLVFVFAIATVCSSCADMSNSGTKTDQNRNTNTNNNTTTDRSKEIEEKAKKIDEQIESIESNGLESGGDIEAARKAYDSAEQEVKDAVTNLDILINYENTYAQLVETRGTEAMEYFYTDYDQVEKITWYMPNNLPQYIDTRSYVLPYIGEQGSNVWLVVRWNYTGDDWVFYQKAIIATDSNKYTKYFSYFDIDRDNDGGVVWETMDDSDISENDIKMLMDMATSESTIVRFEGDNDIYDLTLSGSDKGSIYYAIALYRYLLSQK